MKNRIWNEVLCLLGLTATGAMAQDYVVSGRYNTRGADGFQRQTWTSGTYGHVDSLTSAEQTVIEPATLATEKYRYENAPGSPAGYQYTWNSSFDPASVQIPTAQPKVKYQWPDGRVTEETLSATEITDESLSSTTLQSGGETITTVESTVKETEYRWAGGEPTVTEVSETADLTEVSSSYPRYQPLRRTHIQRTEWDAFSSRLSFKARFSFNVNTDFRSGNPNNTGAAAGAGNRFYDNGFVAQDASTADTTTWFYRYDNNPAFPGTGGQNPVVDQLFFHSVSSPADGQVRGANDILPGVEVNYEEIFGSRRVVGERPWGFGLIAGISFANVDHRSNEGLTGVATILEDRYTTAGGGPPNGPGVQGTFNAPPAGGFALLNDGPVRQPGFTSPAVGTLLNDLNGQLYAFEIGPLMEIPITEAVSAVLAGGFGMVLADLEYAFNEAFTLTTIQNGSPGAIARSGSVSEATLLMGGFARLNLRYQFDDRWAAELGFQYQNLGDTDRRVGGKSATLVLDHVFSVNGGVSYAF